MSHHRDMLPTICIRQNLGDQMRVVLKVAPSWTTWTKMYPRKSEPEDNVSLVKDLNDGHQLAADLFVTLSPGV